MAGKKVFTSFEALAAHFAPVMPKPPKKKPAELKAVDVGDVIEEPSKSKKKSKPHKARKNAE